MNGLDPRIAPAFEAFCAQARIQPSSVAMAGARTSMLRAVSMLPPLPPFPGGGGHGGGGQGGGGHGGGGGGGGGFVPWHLGPVAKGLIGLAVIGGGGLGAVLGSGHHGAAPPPKVPSLSSLDLPVPTPDNSDSPTFAPGEISSDTTSLSSVTTTGVITGVVAGVTTGEATGAAGSGPSDAPPTTVTVSATTSGTSSSQLPVPQPPPLVVPARVCFPPPVPASPPTGGAPVALPICLTLPSLPLPFPAHP